MLHSGLHREVAGVGVAIYPRVDGVGEPALLAHFEEEAATHPAAEYRREDGEREFVFVEVRVGGDAEHKGRLVGLLLLYRNTRLVLLRSERYVVRRIPMGELPKVFRNLCEYLFLVKRAGDTDDRVEGW